MLTTIPTSPYSLIRQKTSGAELVFLPIYYQEASIILKQANDKDFASACSSAVMVWTVSLRVDGL